jgi:hypothetical protein
MSEKLKLATRALEFSKCSSKSFENLDLKTSIHKKNILEVLFSNLKDGGVIQDGAANHCFILSGLAQPKLGTSVFFRQYLNSKWSQYSRLRFYIYLFVRLSLVFSPFSNLQSSNFPEYYIRINGVFGFFDSSSMSSEIEFGLGPFQIKIFFLIFYHFLRIFPFLLKFKIDSMIYFGVQIIKK